jgi:ATP-dependent helicase/nuclease subunit B
VLRAAGREGALDAGAEPLAWQAALDAADRIPSRAPAPCPPVAARPRRLSVTEIETWMRDPYAIYARRILNLKALEPLDADPGAADRGRIIHRALDQFVKAWPGTLPPDALERLAAFGREAFGTALDRPGIAAFWWPRFERIARWFIAAEAERRAGAATPLGAECRGRLAFPGPGGPFELAGVADRIDLRQSGALGIIDYKTGSLPSNREVELGVAPQLALEAAIAEAGGFEGIAAALVEELAFWKLSGLNPPGESCPIAATAAELRARIDEALAGLRDLIACFDDAGTPYRAIPRPELAPRYSDYEHLARIKEWSVTAEREE